MNTRIAPQLVRTLQVVVLAGLRVGEVPQLLQQQRVLEDALDRLDQVALQGGGVLLTRVLPLQELLQLLVTLA